MNISSGAAPSHIQLCCGAPPRPMESKSEGKYDSDDEAKGSGGAKDGGDAKGSSSGGGALIR